MLLLVGQLKEKTTALHILCHKLPLVILVLFFCVQIHVSSVSAVLTCHQCRGINCLRTNYAATQNCLNDLDICANVFDGQTLVAQGCWEQLNEELRNKCESPAESRECFKCNENLCNNFSSSSFECIQCDSDNIEDCRTNPIDLTPSRCGVSRTPNEYCFIKKEGQRIIRGCSYTLQEQLSCLSSDDCMLCLPSELKSCNNIELVAIDDSGSGGSSSGNGDSDGSDSEGNSAGSRPTESSESVNGSIAGSTQGSSSNGGNSQGAGDSTSNTEEGGSDSGNGGSVNGSNGCSTLFMNTNILINIFIIFFIAT